MYNIKTTNMFRSLGCAALCVLGLMTTSCDENSWNNEHLDGFDTPEASVNKIVNDTIMHRP